MSIEHQNIVHVPSTGDLIFSKGLRTPLAISGRSPSPEAAGDRTQGGGRSHERGREAGKKAVRTIGTGAGRASSHGAQPIMPQGRTKKELRSKDA